MKTLPTHLPSSPPATSTAAATPAPAAASVVALMPRLALPAGRVGAAVLAEGGAALRALVVLAALLVEGRLKRGRRGLGGLDAGVGGVQRPKGCRGGCGGRASQRTLVGKIRVGELKFLATPLLPPVIRRLPLPVLLPDSGLLQRCFGKPGQVYWPVPPRPAQAP